MDLTGWLDYFVAGLETQMPEVRDHVERVIRRDLLAKKHGLNERQTRLLGSLLSGSAFSIQDFEILVPGTGELG